MQQTQPCQSCCPHISSTFSFPETGLGVTQLAGETSPCFRWCTVRKLIQQSKTVEPSGTCQHGFISAGQTRPPLFPGQIYINSGNFYPSSQLPAFRTCRPFLLCHLPPRPADVTGGAGSGRQAERGERREGRCCCWHTAALPKAKGIQRGGLQRINIMTPHNCINMSTGAAPHWTAIRVRVSSSIRGRGGISLLVTRAVKLK